MARDGFLIMDSDMHVMEPPDLWQRYIADEFKSRAPVGRTSESVRDLGIIFPEDSPSLTGGAPHYGRNYERNQKLYADHARRGWTGEVQLDAMDAEGLDVAILFPSRGLSVLTHPDQEPRYAAAIARAYNDWMYDLCQTDTNRLIGAGMVSVYDIQSAVEEVHRCVEDLRFKSIFLRSNVVNGRQWYDPYYEPLWDVLEKLDVPLGFHEASGSRSRQVGEQYADNFGIKRIYAQPMTQMLALGAFIGGGVLERHPRLKVAFLEANCSWVPWLIWRMDESYELEGDLFMKDLSMLPSEYFKRQCFVSVEPDETPARYMIQEFGADQLVFSTDYPHGDSRFPNATNAFLELPISDEDKRKILWDNCASFYHVETPVAAAVKS
ncbi:MAG TPA: amidohydrolase family protein [Chloroflexota bacterium]|nr:amidohydrolase family protein [Chloroflexota bacterium]